MEKKNQMSENESENKINKSENKTNESVNDNNGSENEINDAVNEITESENESKDTGKDREYKTKQRIIYLQKILWERTDEEHPLSTNQIITILNEEYKIPAHRTTISNDIKLLKGIGMDIVTIVTTQNKYFIGERTFELPELKLLIDAVESSNLITHKKSRVLVDKIHRMASKDQALKLQRNTYALHRPKADNENIYYIVDGINEAINSGKQIAFQYYDYTGEKKKVLRNDGEVYVLSPYKFIWSSEKYYIIGYSKKHEKVINLRVDRIKETPNILEDDIIPMPEDFDIENYAKEVFFMFQGDKFRVDLKCDNALMKTMIDRFGEDIETHVSDNNSFVLRTEVLAGPTFFGWVFGFDGKVSIVGPREVREQYVKMIKNACMKVS